ncbi:MAG: Tad domain-containing protein [Actinomycetia bacterium]|nr:Tad domain-containing protein [Actinomycetes bacterium]
MRRLTDRLTTVFSRDRGLRSEGGTVIAFVAIAMVVLLGAVAMSVDVGLIYSERRELQNGADAAALAVAYDCAAGDCGSSIEQQNRAEEYADANASDGLAWADDVTIDLGAQTVRVHTSTEDPGGDHFFDTTFAQIVGFDGLTVGAEATVAWGALRSRSTLPIIISDCEWDNILAADNLHPRTIVDPGPLPTEDGLTTLLFHGSEEPCAPSPSGFDDSGGFGWLDENAGPCEALMVQGGEVDGRTGAEASKDCKAILDALVETVQVIPYYNDLREPGGNRVYTVAGFGAFYITGYRFPGINHKSVITGEMPCTGSDNCIEAFAIGDWVVDDGTIGGTGDFGVVTVAFVK